MFLRPYSRVRSWSPYDHCNTRRSQKHWADAVKEVLVRLKAFWAADDGNIVEAKRFHALVVVMVMHAGIATVPARLDPALPRTRRRAAPHRVASVMEFQSRNI
ncbi:MAG: hypothetical protein AMXMBFR83_17840 [Phycisphaerae bacterium]